MTLGVQTIKLILLSLISSWLLFSLPSYANTENTSSASSTKTEITNLEPVSLQLKWLHQFQFAGYYAAKIKGFYQDEGLDVTIKPREVFVNNIEQVIDGESEYGIADSMLMLYQAQGAPLSIVSPIYQHSPQVFITLKSSGINSLYDLNGKNVAFYQTDTDGFPLLAMMHHNNVVPNLDRVIIKSGPEMLEQGQVQAYPGYLSNEAYYFYQKGIKINIFNPMNYGIDFYGDLIFTNNNELNNHPNRVAAFKRASLKGWEYALNHKEEIINYLINDLKVEKSFEHLMYESQVVEEAIKPKTIPIGTLDTGRLEYIKKLLVKHDLLNNKFDVSKGVYKEKSKNFTLTKEEIDWVNKHPVVKVAIDNNWAPFEFIDKNGEYDGIAHDYLDYLTAFTGIKFIPDKSLSWDEAVESVKTHKLDMFSAVVNTPERSKYVNFTTPYLDFPTIIATLKGENYINSLTQLKDKTLTVGKNYVAHELLKNNYPELKLLLVENPAKGLEAVSQGRAYAYIDNAAVVAHNIRSLGFSNIQISGETPFKANVSMAIRKDWPELHSIIQKALDSINAETKRNISNRWLKIEYQQEIEWRRVLILAIPVILIIFVILLYNRRLKSLNSRLQVINKKLIDTQSTLEEANIQLETLSITDFLTGAYNRKYTDHVLESEISLSNRSNTPLSILLFDLDNFKHINDKYGHLIGDEVLKAVCQSIMTQIRISDTLGRWGGEEFILICPATDHQQAEVIATKILSGVSQIKFEEGFTQTISIGLASHVQNEPMLKFLDRADNYLYKAKNLGKNQIVSSTTE
ncbi:transporter substrate-binding domain-containing diguanylate cyclase [Thiomicrorhabdus lithotrophica]|uniref:diguanylate cyclase n=1 Tax=Thiomicrorhabdus lithotrophica TaxID=2949997 RepID=A0ABY8CBZ0_9GAMM|nr:transporter substrate-binding domain-containing protein [Thiomicrorhabdus lithotrophica]WEJ62317.1 ABC transporter substrate-binding protein [Thiomicrorhabdus lithotrophica]